MLTVPFPQIPLVHLCDAKFFLGTSKENVELPKDITFYLINLPLLSPD